MKIYYIPPGIIGLVCIVLCMQGCVRKQKPEIDKASQEEKQEQQYAEQSPQALLDETRKVFAEKNEALKQRVRSIGKKARQFKHEVKHELKEIKSDVKNSAHTMIDKAKKTITGTLAVGSIAPNFTLNDEQGNARTLEEFKGRRIVLYFYPMDDTPGCAKQACSIRDSYSLFEKNKIVVLGVSYGSVSSHKKFKVKYNLPFILLSDDKKMVAKMYEARSLWMFVPQRKTYLIDEQGIIKDIMNNVDPATHTGLVLARFGVH